MPVVKIGEGLYSVGVADPDLRVFDIVMRTEYGTTYNSYLLIGTEKVALIEGVKSKFAKEQLDNLAQVLGERRVDYIVVNHTEPDHSSGVGRLLDHSPDAVVVGTRGALTFLRRILDRSFASRPASEAEPVELGGLTLKFMILPMLHWPDTMYTYVPERNALFPCDSFGCHYADPRGRVFSDEIGGDFEDAYKYYFDNIIGPYKRPYMTNALSKIGGLPIDLICPGHGPVLRGDVQRYVGLYRHWCGPASGEKRAAIAYVSAYGYTRALAERIKDGLTRAGLREIALFDLVTDDLSAAQRAVAESDGFLLGSPTLVGDALPPVWQMLLAINPIIHKDRLAGAFGSYGWSGEACPNLIARMEQLKLRVPLPPFKVQLRPTQTQLTEAEAYGFAFGRAVMGAEQ